jgi:Fe-Mn family superoxide dismutase
MDEHYPYALPALPWDYDALEPELDAKTVMLHHDRHFAGYIDTLNRLLEPWPEYQKWPLRKLCMEWSALPAEIRQQVRVAAGGVYNHDLYFLNLQPTPVSAPLPPLDGAIVRCFGDLPGLRRALKAQALAQVGSGWAFLCCNSDGQLCVQHCDNQDTPLPLTPLLCCDVWEHAYYLGSQNRRSDYFDHWWHLVNWPRVSRAYELCCSCRPHRPMP